MIEKPPILSDEQITRAYGSDEIWRLSWAGVTDIAKAQRDADVAYYEPLIQRIIEQTRKLLKPIGQAKAEVAREIFEEIYGKCSLEVQNIHSSCAMDRLVIKRGEFQSLQCKYTGEKK